jgi:hypothetical protein
MRRPLPPELIALGDQLEAAAARALARRRTRRQLVLNAVASMVIVLPFGVTLATSQITAARLQLPIIVVTPAPGTAEDPNAQLTHVPVDILPRDLRRMRTPQHAELLSLPSSLRPALR